MPPEVGAIGPAWTRGEIEKPAGTKDMGGWTAGATTSVPPASMLESLRLSPSHQVYTAEQQARLGRQSHWPIVALKVRLAAA